MTDLRQTLADAYLPRPVPADVRARRQRLCEFVRRNESHVYDVDHPRAATVRALLGWDDETMAAFVDSPLLCHSSPHAGMNSLPPMLGFPWLLGQAARAAEERHGAAAMHARTQCTHHDFNDTFSKPHAWWHRGPAGDVVKTHLFARLPIKYHPILSKAVPRLRDEPLHAVDRDAVELAELGTNYAYYCVIYRMHLERLAGFHAPHRVIEFPIDLLNRFTIEELGLLEWFDVIDGAGMHLRLERENAPMAVLSRSDAEAMAQAGRRWLDRAVIAPNMVNFTQFYLLGLALMVGGRRMAGYVPEMNAKIDKFVSGVDGWDCEPPAFLPFTNVPLVDALGLQDEAARCQREYGFPTSLPLVVSAVGADASARLAPLLDLDYGVFFDHGGH
jgi:hypothetical protein